MLRPFSRCEFARFDLVYITPNPAFPGLDRAYQRMLCVVKMFRGVFVWGRVAACGVPADQTHAQVDPGAANLHAVFTHVFVCRSNFDLIEMGTLFCHGYLLLRVKLR
jgi:hypothetical protein